MSGLSERLGCIVANFQLSNSLIDVGRKIPIFFTHSVNNRLEKVETDESIFS